MPNNLVVLALAAVIAIAWSGIAGAADLPGPDDITVPSRTGAPGPTPGPAPDGGTVTPEELEAERIAVQAFGDKNPSCAAWGDGCVTCQAAETGAPVCANPGPACLPREIACTRQKTPPAAPPATPAK